MIELNTTGFLGFDTDGEYLTLFLDEPKKDNAGRWYAEDPARILIIRRVYNSSVIFTVDGRELAAGEKIKFNGLELD